MEVGIFEGRNRFSELVEAAERGEETVVLRRGKPVAKLVPIHEPDVALAAARRKALDSFADLRAATVRAVGRPFTHDELISARDEGRR